MHRGGQIDSARVSANHRLLLSREYIQYEVEIGYTPSICVHLNRLWATAGAERRREREREKVRRVESEFRFSIGTEKGLITCCSIGSKRVRTIERYSRLRNGFKWMNYCHFVPLDSCTTHISYGSIVCLFSTLESSRNHSHEKPLVLDHSAHGPQRAGQETAD